MRGILVALFAFSTVWAAEVPVDLKSPSDGAKITNTYSKTDLEVELRVTWRKPGTLLDTIGIDAAPVGSLALSVGADGAYTLAIYDPARRGGANAGNGWHVMPNPAKTAADQPTKVILKLRDGKLALLVGEQVARWDWPTPLSGQPIYVGDYKGDEHWGSKYNISRGMVGGVVLVYFGASRGPSSAAGAAPATPPGPTGALPEPATAPIIDELLVLSAEQKQQLAADLAALRAKGIALGLVVARNQPADGGVYRTRLVASGQLPQLSGVLIDCARAYVLQYDSRFPQLLTTDAVNRAWSAASALPQGVRLLAVTQALRSGSGGGSVSKPVEVPTPVAGGTGSAAGDVAALEAALRARDAAKALAGLAPDAAARCRELFAQRPETMAQLAALLATRRLVAERARIAEYEVTDQGRRFAVTFELVDGRWCLSRF